MRATTQANAPMRLITIKMDYGIVKTTAVLDTLTAKKSLHLPHKMPALVPAFPIA
jgi:hypothetical protein